MILLIEGIAGRDLSLRVKKRIQQLGFAVLATLMIVVLYNDVDLERAQCQERVIAPRRGRRVGRRLKTGVIVVTSVIAGDR